MSAPTPVVLLRSRRLRLSVSAARVRATKSLVPVGLAVLMAIAGAATTHAACTIDVQGADDEPGQKDLGKFCNNGTCNGTNNSYAVSFDDRNWSGNNTGDGCLLFDTDGDGYANRAVCGTLTGAGVLQTGSPTCYTCSNTRPDRCTGSAPVGCTTTCTATATGDPFAGDLTHVGNVCAGTNCLTFDSTLTCCVTAADRGGAVGVLIDACSYPSSQANSDPSDCIVTRECSKNNPNDPVCNDNNPCTVDTCDTAVGVCHHVAGNAGAVCRTGAGVCDVAETCTGTSIDCPDDGYATGGVCRPATDVCDALESCDGSGPNCPADLPASGGICRPAAGQCDASESCDGVNKSCPANAPKPNNTPCTDGNACTNGDVCIGGQCVSGNATVCPDDGNPCTDRTCNPTTGICDVSNNTGPCSDGNACTSPDVCGGGTCHPGATTVCNSTNPCIDEACNTTTGACDPTNNTNACNDEDPCTSGDICSGGQCAGPGQTDCDSHNACIADSCDSATVDGCVHTGIAGCCNTDAECADADLCTINERCVNHACVSDPVTTCDDGNVCTDDACSDPQDADHNGSGCVFTNNTAGCDDGNACTNPDVCGGGTCQPGAATVCPEDGNPCTDEKCNTTSGACESKNDDSNSCSDDNACTNGDFCSGGDCKPGTLATCPEDGNPCTDEKCNTTSGVCEPVNDDSNTCSDNDACTIGDFCSSGQCKSGVGKTCDDNNVCTTDDCNSTSGDCVFTANDKPCEDGLFCTGPDFCFEKACQGGPVNQCNDHLTCTDDACVEPVPNGEPGHCEHTPVDHPCCDVDADCRDQDGCTINEACVSNSCLSDQAECADTPNDDPCTIDSCTSMSANDFKCVRQECSELQGNQCPTGHPECLPLTCGNGVVDPANNETCDPPGSTTTPNGNPCRSDCTYCGDGIKNGTETCDDGNSVTGCSTIHPQQAADECGNDCKVALCKDPAKITLAEWIDRYDVHGRLPSSTLVDFASQALVLELTDARGNVLYRSSLRVGSLTGDVAIGKFKYANRSAKAWGGLGKVKISRHKDGYRLTATTYGNLFASRAEMVTNVYSGSDQWTVDGDWKQTKQGWKFIQ